ncbi:hypothetical protein F4803DRAFT_544032 [Xylaria telfairii]|nr:hypothetical protein F4803DRAFT_544032 [Xylaria telfairii]
MWSFTGRYPTKTCEEVSRQKYDYIIVGGGTAGCAIASRLSEDSSLRVLLLEKGPLANSWFTKVPLLSSVTDKSYVASRYTESGTQPNNRRIRLYAAEAMGGDSRINGMLWTRGIPAYYNQWARRGYPTWDWAHVGPYFARIENRVHDTTGDRPAENGPLQILRYAPVFELYSYMKKSAAALGLSTISNGDSLKDPGTGFYDLDYTIDSHGYRHSAFDAYLPQHLAIQRQGWLHICPNATVSRLALETTQDCVTGVFIRSLNGRDELLVKVNREVILSCGSIRTPQLLQLSGIGPAPLLRQHGIQVVCDLEGVGLGLKDHATIPVLVELPFHQTIHLLEKSPLQALKHVLLFAISGSGWLKSPVMTSTIYMNTSHLKPDGSGVQRADLSNVAPKIPDAEVMVIAACAAQEPQVGKSTMTLLTCINQPKSSGSIKIRSRDPLTDPAIVLNCLSHPHDRSVARKALRFTLHLADHFMEHSGYNHPTSLLLAPNAGKGKLWSELSDEELDEYADANVAAAYHLVGSCRMDDARNGGVVDDELRVHGFRNLRIADASIFPTATASHPMASVYMVAERCADFVTEAWKAA